MGVIYTPAETLATGKWEDGGSPYLGQAMRTTPESELYMQAKLDIWLAEQQPIQVEAFEAVEMG